MKIKYLVILIVVILGWYFIRFANTDKTKMPPKFKNDRSAFVDSVIALNKARDLTQPPEDSKNGMFKLSEDVELEAFSLAEKGINLSKDVSDDFLDYLHPELSVIYHQKLIRGAELWLEGVRMNNLTSGVEKQIKGSALTEEWINWFEAHGRSFEDKIF